MQHTTNYNLNQWEASDRVTRADFNADNAKIDAALAAAASAGCRVVAGTYTGDGTAERTINLGGQPKAVYVCTQSGLTYELTGGERYYYGGLAMPGAVVGKPDMDSAVEIASSGFIVRTRSAYPWNVASNRNGIEFHYIAFL